MSYSLERFKEINADKEVVIFTCGPSLGKFNKQKMLNFCKDKVIFTVKQAFHKYGEISNYHFFNDNNFLPYNTEAIKIASSGNLEWARKYIWKEQFKIDLFFRIVNATGDVNQSISGTLDFQKMLLSSQKERVWGPGIMYETVLPFALYTGTKKIYVNGWDYTTTEEGTLKHYYDEKKAEKILINTGNKIGEMANKEKEVFLKSTDSMYDFLKTLGVELKIISNCSELSNKFERILDL